MKKTAMCIAIVLSLVTLLSATTSEPYINWDTFVDEGDPGANHGNEVSFVIWGGSGTTPESKGLLYSQAVDELKAAGMIVDHAELKLYIINTVAAGNASIFKAGDEWADSTVNWNTRPPEDRSAMVEQGFPAGTDIWYVANVTPIVQSWVNDGAPHHGFYIDVFGEFPMGAGCQFASVEDADSTHWPRLFLEYHAGGGAEEQTLDEELYLTLNPAGTSVSLTLHESSPLSLTVYDASGSLVSTIHRDVLSAGTHRFSLGMDPGVYFLSAETSSTYITRKLVTIR